MNSINNVLNTYQNIEETNLSNRWISEYIVPFDKRNVTWLVLTSEELTDFLNRNYCDHTTSNYVGWNNSFLYNVLGMKYMGYINIIPGFNYLIGVIPNNIGNLTIVASLCFSNDYFFELDQVNGVNWIQMVETNVFYQNNGLFSEICKLIPSVIDYSKDVILTDESEEGMIHHVYDKITSSLIKSGFNKEILSKSNITKEYIKKITR